MSQATKSNRTKTTSLVFLAAATTVIGGIIHVLLSTHSEPGEETQGIFFLVGGLLQIFWAVPVVKGWNRMWQYVGIGGTAVMIILWAVTHVRALSHGRGLGPMTLTLEASQFVFIGLCMALLKVRPTIRDKAGTTPSLGK